MLIVMLYNLTCSWVVNASLLVGTTICIILIQLEASMIATFPIGALIFSIIATLALMSLAIIFLIEKEHQMRKNAVFQFDLIVSIYSLKRDSSLFAIFRDKTSRQAFSGISPTALSLRMQTKYYTSIVKRGICSAA